MKRSSYALVLLVFLFIFLTGCQDNVEKIEEPQPEAEVETTVIEPAASDTLDTGNMTKLREFSTDLDLDNNEERIELYTAAECNEKGEMVWDDGQNWVLVVRDGEKSYPLLSQYVQLGVVYFTVSNRGADQMPNITVMVPTGASFSMMGYTYDKEKDSFKGVLLYGSEDDNWLYSSIPGY